MEAVLIGVALLAYFEIRDYRQASRFKAMRTEYARMSRKVDTMRSDLDKIATLPDRVGVLAENAAKTSADMVEVLNKSEFLVKEYETVLHYRKQIASASSADFFEG